MEPPKKTVGEVSRLFGVSPRMMRYYEKMGLLRSERIEGYAYRVFGERKSKKYRKFCYYGGCAYRCGISRCC